MEKRKLTSNDREAYAKLARYAFFSTENTYDNVVPEDYEKSKPHLKDMSQVYGCFEKDKLVSSAAYFKSSVVIRNKTLPMSGIWGVATAPNYRNKGLIRQLLIQMLNDQYHEKIPISVLHPFKFAFYEKFGWRLADEVHRYHIEIDNINYKEIADRTIREVYELDHIKEVYSKVITQKYNYMVKRTTGDWRRKVDPKKPGFIFVCYDSNDNPCGYLILRFLEHEPPSYEGVEQCRETIYLPEIFWLDRKTKQCLFNFLQKHIDHRKYVLFSCADSNIQVFLKEPRVKAHDVFPGSMVRIVDIIPVIEIFDYPEDTDFILKVTDQWCDWNNNTYNCKISEQKATLEKSTKSPDVTIDIGSLSQMVVGYRNASQLHDSWEINCSKDMIPILDRLFPKQNNFFRDFF